MNGAMGTVKQIVRLSDDPNSTVQKLLVEFDGIEGVVAIMQ